MKKYFSKGALAHIKTVILAHKVITGIVVVVVLGGGYYEYKKATNTGGETRYVLAVAEKGTLVTSISGTGQISASNQIDIKPKASGEIVWVGVKAGDVVRAGQALMSIDNTDAQKAVTSAEQNLVTAKLQLQKDTATAPIDYQKAQDDLAVAKDDLSTTFNDAFSTLSDTYLDLSTVITGTQNVLYGYDLSPVTKQWNVDVLNNMFNTKEDQKLKLDTFTQSAKDDYATARTKYDASVAAYKATSRASSPDVVETILTQSIDTTTAIAQALQSELNFIGLISDLSQLYDIKLPTTVTTIQTNARNYLSTANSGLSSLLSQKKSIDASNQTIKTDEQNISLMQVGNTNGDNPISLQIEQNNLATQEQNLEQLKQDLNDYTIVAPFAGTLSAVSVKKGDNAGSAAVASIITNQTFAQITLNEIDVAKIKLGDKATITLDAIDGLSITGTVAEIDTVGTVSQGVVSYTVKINFDTQDTRVRPGMTVNADIQTAVHTDVVYVPSSAVKTAGGNTYVLAFTPPLPDTGVSTGVTSATPPQQIPVTTGISDDTNIEILSGLSEGEQIVSRTTTGTTASRTTSAPTATSLLGGGRAAGAGFTAGAGVRAGAGR